MGKFICFGLEGVLSPQDSTAGLARLIPRGEELLKLLSHYDNNEPGNTLSLLLPFLVRHAPQSDICLPASDAPLTTGAEKLVSRLQYQGWKVFCITAACEQYAQHLTQKLGIYSHYLASTQVPWDELRGALGSEEATLISQAEKDILAMKPADSQTQQRLARFYKELETTAFGKVLQRVKPMAGEQKVRALNEFAAKYDQPLDTWAVVGDGITDSEMLKAVETAGGLAITFNAIAAALSQATMSLAAKSIDTLKPVLEAWRKNQRRNVEKVVRKKGRGGSPEKGYFHWLSGSEDSNAVAEIHQKLRQSLE